MNFSLSYTAPVFTEEDEEREFADLETNEKQSFINNLYGQNAEELAVANGREITQQELDDFQKAIERIPVSDQTGYQMAMIRCPELLNTETDPKLFLRCEEYSAEKAAQRMVHYWNMRVKIFGDDRAFLPLTLSGALKDDEELFQMFRDFPRFRTFLPDDDHGRTVAYTEAPHIDYNNYGRILKMKYIWYFVHVAMKKQSTILKGLVFIVAPARYKEFKLFDRLFYKMLIESVNECLPVKVRSVHLFANSNSITKLLLPMIKYFMNKETRHIHKVHERLDPEILVPYGIQPENVPRFIGGTFDAYPNWQWNGHAE